MKKLIFLLALSAFSQQTGYKLNPFTGLLDLAGNGYTAPSGYSATVTAQTTLTVTAATHGQGTAPVAFCFDNASPALAVSCSYTVSSIGDVVFSWSPSFTGTVIIRGPGANAGAAGDVVGPSSSTSGCVSYFSGTSGKIITCAPTGLFYDSINVRLGVGTGSPGAKVDIYSSAIASDGLRLTHNAAGAKTWALRSGIVGIDDASFEIRNVTASATVMRIGDTGNASFGGSATTDYKLDIQSSGSTGTLRVYDQGGAGSTLAVIRAGAAQSGSVLKIQNNAGSDTVTVSEGGLINTAASGGFTTSGDTSIYYYSTYARLMSASTFQIQWRDGVTWYGGSIDSGISRNTAGVIESNNGSTTVLRDFLARQYKNTPVAVTSLQTCNAGNKGSLASVSDALAPAWGVTVANGGAAYAQVTCNGTNWTVTGI